MLPTFTPRWTVVPVFLMIYGNYAAAITWSSVRLSTCTVPIEHVPFSLCCITENVPKSASVFFYRTVSNIKAHVVRIGPSCDILYPDSMYTEWNISCSADGNYSIINHGSTWSDMYGEWGCGFYGNSSSFSITETNVLTNHQGYHLYHHGDSPTLQWLLSSNVSSTNGLVQIYNPSLDKIFEKTNDTITYVADNIEFVGNIGIGNITIRMKALNNSDNGTYVCMYRNKLGLEIRDGITVVVLAKPPVPVINITASSGSSGIVSCSSESQSAAPLFYVPQLHHDWLVPGSDSSYNTTANGNALYITKLDCTQSESLPIYCNVMEGDIKSFDSQPFYPSLLCGPSDVVTSPPEYDSRITALVGCLVTFVVAFVFTLSISIVVGRVAVKRKVNRCFRKCCSLSECCRTALSVSSDSDSDLDSMLRRSEDDLGDHRPRRPRRPRLSGMDNSIGLQDGLSRRQEELEIQEAIERSRVHYNINTGSPEDGAVGAGQDPHVRRHSLDLGDMDISVDGDEVGATAAPPRAVPPPLDENRVLDEVEHLLEQHNRHLDGNSVINLEVHRDNIVNNVIGYYTDHVLATSRVTVKMVGEDGMDCGGVTDDMYTTFWYRAHEQFFIGYEAVVPYLPAHKLAEEANFRILGRILSHSLAILKAFPLPMCKSAVIVMIYDTTNVAPDTLLEDFLFFLDPHDRTLVTSALGDFGALTREQTDEVQTIFERYEYGVIANADNIKEHITQLARTVICIRPKPLLDLMRSGIPDAHMEHFWMNLHLNYLDILFRALKPTPARVISRLRTEQRQGDLSRKQTKAFGYLKDLLREMSVPELETFLHFVTGKKSTPRQVIMVTFTDSTGFQRVPKAHTCSNLLELPATYENYDTFRSELKHILASDDAMTMSMA